MNESIQDAGLDTGCAVELIRDGGDWPEGEDLDRLVIAAARLAVETGIQHMDDGPDSASPDIASEEARPHINIMLGNDQMIRRLNHQFRGLDQATNVLSFSFGEAEPLNPDETGMLGDVILAFETVEREARTKGISFAHHTAHLVVHGALHLLGFDHGQDDEADEMEKLEIAVLSELNIPDPYAELGSEAGNSHKISQLVPGE